MSICNSFKMLGMISSRLLLWLLLLQITTVLSFSFKLPRDRGNETDRFSLLAFKDQITNDPLGMLNSWNESLHFCKWSGVRCGHRHRRVIELNLQSGRLAGGLSPHIGNLSFLRILDLQNNSFTHDIPPDIGRLFRLQYLILAYNMFSGEIPINISRCSHLLELRLEKNNLAGKLPVELGSLSKLHEIVFQQNNLVGLIPPSFGNLSSLAVVGGAENHFQRGIPNSIGELRNLQVFAFDGNNLSGTIPPSIYNLSSLNALAVSDNQLHGSLPANLGESLPNLNILSVFKNQFTGLIPATLSNASKLTVIELDENFLTGKVPILESLSNLQALSIEFNDLGDGEDDDMRFLYHLANNTNLEGLGIHDNNLGGVLPEIVSNFSTKLKTITAGNNLIRGSIPREIGNLVNLHALALEMNQLSGTIPSSIGKLQNLVELGLDFNKITGTIPSSLGNITTLMGIDFENNNLQGRIPSSLGNCRNLLVLELQVNNLTGPIPKEVIGISSLSLSLNLSENQLIGPLPSEVGRLVNLGILDVSKNKLSGKIPASLGNCLSMESLHLGRNFFQGSIPQSLSSLRAISELNLSHNNLTGQIPMFLAEFKLLTSLDLSSNDFEGEVPLLGVFKNASAILISVNKRLCGGMPQLNLSRCTFHESSRSRSSSKWIMVSAIIPSCFLAIISVISALSFYYYRKTKSQHASGASWEISFQRISYQELFQATGGFSSSNLIGTGAFGSVYKGIIASDGAVVAVKVFNFLCRGASRSFLAECEALINIRHRNLVKVLTACSGIDFQGNDFKALVFQFLVNGSLEEWLHPTQIPNEAHEPRNLNLVQRLNIAIDVANALDYLHHHCQTTIVHCDIKPSNILLDSDMIAHVGDFGLATFRPKDPNQTSFDQSSSVGVKGTIGYAAPEYGIESEVSTYGDVYSYGTLLLEMFTGKRPTDGLFKEGLSLHNNVKMALPERVMEIVDPIILREAEEASVAAARRTTNETKECLLSIMEVGIACSLELPRERMEISSAASELDRVRRILSKTRRTRRRSYEMKDSVFNVQEGAAEPNI